MLAGGDGLLASEYPHRRYAFRMLAYPLDSPSPYFLLCYIIFTTATSGCSGCSVNGCSVNVNIGRNCCLYKQRLGAFSGEGQSHAQTQIQQQCG